MDVFLMIMFYSVLVLGGLSLLSAILVAGAAWLIDNSEDQPAH